MTVNKKPFSSDIIKKYNLAKKLELKNNFKKAIELYKECISLYPDFAEAYYRLSMAITFSNPQKMPEKLIEEQDYYWHQAHKIIKQNPNYKPIDEDTYFDIIGKTSKDNGILKNEDIEYLLNAITGGLRVEDYKEEYKRISSKKGLTPKEYRDTYGIIPSNQELRKKGFTDNDLIEIGLL